MPLISPTSSRGSTLGRIRWKMRNISAVQRPMPRIATSSAMMASSSMPCQPSTCSLPHRNAGQVHQVLDLAHRQAGSAHVVDLELEHIARRNGRDKAAKRSHTVCAALTEICCPTMERASVLKASPRDCSGHRPVAGSGASSPGPFFIRCARIHPVAGRPGRSLDAIFCS